MPIRSCGAASNQQRPTWQGSVAAIFVTPESAGEMVSLPDVRAFADRGLEGDRFFRESWNAVNRSDKAVSLIEDEVLQLAAQELGVDIDRRVKPGAISSLAACR